MEKKEQPRKHRSGYLNLSRLFLQSTRFTKYSNQNVSRYLSIHYYAMGER
ncbi:hypothetical protein CM49_06644 [Paenibacillus sp. P1XP2]|nr:hypothetical protein CM49_06644 [Paenibacillus sp. P1XP2]